MKILYVANPLNSYRVAGFLNDYLCDLLFYGLYCNENVEITDSTPLYHMYSQTTNVPENQLWGKGFTSCFLIHEDYRSVNRDHIQEQIKDKYYDYIIYGSIWRCQDYYELVSDCYDNEKIIIVDGEDKTDILNFVEKHTYFKRELIYDHPNLRPIHFAIPKSKICKSKPVKSREISNSIPYLNTNQNQYLFDNEQDYYLDYQKSKYAITMKKAGWDCMRHYEIISNYCMPLFLNLDNIPSTILTNFDKKLLKQCNSSFIDESIYNETLEQIYNYLLDNLTTDNLATDFLHQIT